MVCFSLWLDKSCWLLSGMTIGVEEIQRCFFFIYISLPVLSAHNCLIGNMFTINGSSTSINLSHTVKKPALYPIVYQWVIDGVVKDALLHCKRASFTLQKGIFCNAKGHLLQCKRALLFSDSDFFLQWRLLFRFPIRTGFFSHRPWRVGRDRMLYI